MPAFDLDELQRGFQHYQDTVAEAASSGDWDRFADLFTDDAVYREHAYGTFTGREEIRGWILRTMGTFPGNRMPGFPIAWSILDPERGWIACEIRNLMADPGDGSVHEASNFTKLHYAGDGRFSYEEDVYNPAHFATLVMRWSRAAAAHGRLPAEDRAWLDRAMPGWDG